MIEVFFSTEITSKVFRIFQENWKRNIDSVSEYLYKIINRIFQKSIILTINYYGWLSVIASIIKLINIWKYWDSELLGGIMIEMNRWRSN